MLESRSDSVFRLFSGKSEAAESVHRAPEQDDRKDRQRGPRGLGLEYLFITRPEEAWSSGQSGRLWKIEAGGPGLDSSSDQVVFFFSPRA